MTSVPSVEILHHDGTVGSNLVVQCQSASEPSKRHREPQLCFSTCRISAMTKRNRHCKERSLMPTSEKHINVGEKLNSAACSAPQDLQHTDTTSTPRRHSAPKKTHRQHSGKQKENSSLNSKDIDVMDLKPFMYDMHGQARRICRNKCQCHFPRSIFTLQCQVAFATAHSRRCEVNLVLHGSINHRVEQTEVWQTCFDQRIH